METNKKKIAANLAQITDVKRVLVDEPMSNHTTFKIGGAADYFVMPVSADEVSAILRVAKSYDQPVTVLGNGSNILVRDGGIRGIVIKFGEEFSFLKTAENLVVAGAGALLKDVSRYAADFGLTGLEFAIGIPGSIGGAVFMNAGAYDGEMSSVVEKVTAVCPDGAVRTFETPELDFGYRHSVFQDNKCLICEVVLRLKIGELPSINNRMEDLTSRRSAKQPLEMPSAGSTFKRPPGHFAGTLIEQTGLKGFKVGGAQVSEKHAGFIINAGGATAKDVISLIKEIQNRVNEKFGVMLQPEVKIIGEELVQE